MIKSVHNQKKEKGKWIQMFKYYFNQAPKNKQEGIACLKEYNLFSQSEKPDQVLSLTDVMGEVY